MTEQQHFDVITRYDEFDLRQYPDHVLVQVDVDGDFLRAGNRGFRPLFRYISGNNDRASRISMTAPVIQQPLGALSHTISFVLPDGTTRSNVPLPGDAQVRTIEIVAHRVAARRFSGRMSESKFAQNRQTLLDSVNRAGLRLDGEVYSARFDPPWRPGFLKHNEVLVAIARD